ncbi:MAG: hypothetical protein ACRD3D_14045 [Terriglobia bacterium]
MTMHRFGRRPTALLILAALSIAGFASAQEGSPGPQAAQVRTQPHRKMETPEQNPSSSPATRPYQTFDEESMQGTRREFLDLMRSHPRFWAAVQIDPSLLADQDYVNRDPVIADFFARHPEVARDPDYFVGANGSIPFFREGRQEPSEWRDVAGFIGPFLVFVIILGALLWIFKVVLENRRWSRLSKIQTDLHTKLLEKFTSNQELFAYMETDAGKRFLESAPIAADLGQAPRLSAPFGRILWSAQLGLITALAGIGLLAIRADVIGGEQPLLVFGTLGVCIGCGFIVAAVASYGLSRHLGLFDRASIPAGKLGAGEIPKSFT